MCDFYPTSLCAVYRVHTLFKDRHNGGAECYSILGISYNIHAFYWNLLKRTLVILSESYYYHCPKFPLGDLGAEAGSVLLFLTDMADNKKIATFEA